MQATKSPVQASVPSPEREKSKAPVSWAQLLIDAANEPGRIHEAYRAFHGYSIGNQMLAYWQCAERGIPPGPIATYRKWGELGRHVVQGQRAISLCQPVTVKDRPAGEGGKENVAQRPKARPAGERDKDDAEYRRVFIYRPSWFVLAQTDGEPMVYPETAGWDRARMLAALDIEEEPFSGMNGNCQGYAKPAERRIAINPVAALPMKTTIHEAAHVLLHGGDEAIVDGEQLTHSVKEVEAEATAYIVVQALGLDGGEFARGYIQGYLRALGERAIPEKAARRVFTAAERILAAGRDPVEVELVSLRAEIAMRRSARAHAGSEGA